MKYNLSVGLKIKIILVGLIIVGIAAGSFRFGQFWVDEDTSLSADTVMLQNGQPSLYSKTTSNVYFDNELIPSADPQTFSAYYFDAPGGGDYYGKDKNHKYYQNRIVQ